MKVASQLNMLDDAFNSFSKFSLSLRVSFPSTTVLEVVFFPFPYYYFQFSWITRLLNVYRKLN